MRVNQLLRLLTAPGANQRKGCSARLQTSLSWAAADGTKVLTRRRLFCMRADDSCLGCC